MRPATESAHQEALSSQCQSPWLPVNSSFGGMVTFEDWPALAMRPSWEVDWMVKSTLLV